MNTELERDPELDAILAACSQSHEKFCKVVLRERFTRDFSRSHFQFFEVADDYRIQKILITAHRGWGKTSLVNYAIPAKEIVFSSPKRPSFILPMSATSTLAELQSENLKGELLRNEIVQALLGDIKTDTFSKEFWRIPKGDGVMPRSFGQQVRGLLLENFRPNLLCPDDLETREGVSSKEQRTKMKEWFHTDVAAAVDMSLNSWRIWVIGTVLHQDCLLNELAEDKSWAHLNFPLCDETYKSYWPLYMTDEKCAELANSYRSRGQIRLFYMEYLNIVNPKETAVFSEEQFKYYVEDENSLPVGDPTWTLVDFSDPDMDTMILVDPAKTETATSCETAICVVTLDTRRNRIFFRDYINKHLDHSAIHRETARMIVMYKATVLGFDAGGMDSFAMQPLKDYLISQGIFVEVVQVSNRAPKGEDYASTGFEKAKDARIAAMSGYYHMGCVYHNPNCCQVLEDQLLNFPFSKLKDVADAHSYFIQLADLGDRFFSQETEDKLMSEESKKAQQEYKQLMEEDDDIPLEEFMIDEETEEYLFGYGDRVGSY